MVRPVQIAPAGIDAAQYHEVPVAVDDPRNTEPLVRVIDFGIAAESYYARRDGLNTPYGRPIEGALPDVWVRRGLVDLLESANGQLSEYNVEVLLWDGYRPIETQRALRKHFRDRGLAHGYDPDKYADMFCSNPENFDEADWRTWPTHATGGAIDLTLRNLETHEHLDMGTHFDADGLETLTDYYERTAPREATLDLMRNRRLLVNILRDVGFVNFPNEWWHFDYGTQLASWSDHALATIPASRDVTPSAFRTAFYGAFIPDVGVNGLRNAPAGPVTPPLRVAPRLPPR